MGAVANLMAYVERSKQQPDQLLTRLAEIGQELERAPPWEAEDLAAEQKRLLQELRSHGYGR